MEEGKMVYDKSPEPPVQSDSGAVDAVDLAAEPKKEVDPDGKGAGMIYESGNFTLDHELGDTPMMVPREPIYGAEDGGDNITLKELPNLLRERFTHASERGGVSDFISALDYHEKLLNDNPLIFNPQVTGVARLLIGEGRKLTTNEEKVEFLKKATEFFNSMKVERRK